jgi:hypothetical protein
MLPLATTTVTIIEEGSTGDPYEPGTSTTLATGVRAVIGSPTGTELRLGGDKEVVDAAANLPIDIALSRSCVLIDELTGERWSVTWVRRRTGLGLDHQRAGLVAVKGAASG